MGLFSKLFGGGQQAVRSYLEKGAVILDVRSPQEYDAGHIRGSKNIPLDLLPARLAEIKRWNKPVITVCRSGMRSGTAKAFLQGKGIDVMNGGAWNSLNKLV